MRASDTDIKRFIKCLICPFYSCFTVIALSLCMKRLISPPFISLELKIRSVASLISPGCHSRIRSEFPRDTKSNLPTLLSVWLLDTSTLEWWLSRISCAYFWCSTYWPRHDFQIEVCGYSIFATLSVPVAHGRYPYPYPTRTQNCYRTRSVPAGIPVPVTAKPSQVPMHRLCSY